MTQDINMQSNQVTQNNQGTKVPKIYERDEIIKLSAELICRCERPKDRAHCPRCGRASFDTKVHTKPAISPEGDVIKGCVNYRCKNCSQKFNDVDWYFNCQAPPKIDWAIKKEAIARMKKNAYIHDWEIRIQTEIDRAKILGTTMRKFTYNEETQCKAQTGMDLSDLKRIVRDTQQANAPQWEQPKREDIQWQIDQTKKQLALHEGRLQTNTGDDETQMAIDYLHNKIKKLERTLSQL